MKRKLILALTLFIALPLYKSYACDLCSLYSPGHNLGTTAKGFNMGLAEQFTHFGTMKEDGEKAANPLGQYLDSSITQVFGSYNFNPKIGVQLNVPIIYRAYKRANDSGNSETGSVSGLGDISLGLNYSPYQVVKDKFGFSWRVNGGIKLPTGSSSRLDEELNEGAEDESLPASGIHGHDLVLGSGSVDGLIGTNIFTRYKRFLTTADLQYNIRTRGHINYRFANDLHWNVAPGAYLFLKHNYTLAAQLKISGESKGLDDLDGEAADDTGVTSLFMGPEFNLTVKKHIGATLALDIPAFIDNTAFQAVPTYRLKSAFNFHF